MEVFDNINYLIELINNSKKIPMSEMIIANKYELLDSLEMIKKRLPLELEEARKVLEYKNNIMLEASKEAETLIREAEQYVSSQVASHEITRKAENAGEELINRAKINARELRMGAREYSSNLLFELQKQLETSETKLVENLEYSYNTFIKAVQQDYRDRIESIIGNIDELKKIK